MKKIAIVADNYKLGKFKRELSKKGFSDIEFFPFTEETTSMKIKVPDEEFESAKSKITAICSQVESFFKRQN